MDNCSSESNLSSPKILQQPTLPRQSANRVDRPCDTCRKRKSKCAKDPGQERCVLCTFHDRDCTYFDVPRQRQKRGIREETSNTLVASGEVGDLRGRKKLRTSHSLSDTSLVSPDIEPSSEIPPEPSARSLLDRTLGLHRTTHFKYIGSSSPHERKLLDLIHQDQESAVSRDSFKFRHVADGTTFLSKSDHQTPFSADIDHDLQAVEALIQPHGPDLVELYFRTVHPSYPILHKAVFLEKYGRSYTEFSPALLAAVYLLAMDWWEFDRNLSSHPKPDADALSRLAIKALMDVIYRPKLSSVQAGLLLLQRAGGDSWPLTSQVLAVGEELGLNLDCTEWNIPEWEKGLRRRLAWALLMQDKWGSLIHGRPSHILSSHWQIPPVSLADFPESAADDDDKEGSTEVEKGRLLFIHLTKLTHILCLALETLHTPSQTPIIQNIVATQGVQGLLELVKPLAVQLKDWAHSLPLELHMSSNVQTGKLCSTGHLHLSYFVTEIIIHRHIIRNLSPSTPVKILELCRDAGRARLERAMAFVDALRPEHLQAFWWFAAPKSLAYIRTYGGLLWATSRDEPEREFYRKRLVGFRWGLKVRSRGVRFVEVALREMEESLREIDMSGPPLEDRERVDRGASITGSEVDRAPGYPTGLVPGAVTLVDWEGGGEGGEGMFGRPEQIGLGDFGEAYPGFHQGDLVDASPFGVGVEYAISPEPEARRVNLTQRF